MIRMPVRNSHPPPRRALRQACEECSPPPRRWDPPSWQSHYPPPSEGSQNKENGVRQEKDSYNKTLHTLIEVHNKNETKTRQKCEKNKLQAIQQDKTRRDKPQQDKKRRDKTGQGNKQQVETSQDKPKKAKTRQGKYKHTNLSGNEAYSWAHKINRHKKNK